jgi:predicted nucleic acid-binding protein
MVVSDTSPIRALKYLDLLGLLDDLYGQVVVPLAVERELLQPRRRFEPILLRHLPYMRVVSPTDQARVNELEKRLDRGEAEAIALAVELGADQILVDESAGRAVAAELKLQVIGVFGILIQAKRGGLIPAVGPLIDRLVNELGFFASANLIADILRQAGE